ncbi:MAG TPA: hypothetical protein VHG27_09235 [Xanthobacteraceae bacterium]|nr:hypothetical protein [Xanthobacteraceae bacterium]
MNTAIKPVKPNEDKAADGPDEALAMVSNVEGEIRDFVRRDLAGARRLPHFDAAEFAPGNVGGLIERIGGTSIKEIDHLIGELQLVRDYLQAEGERVQREIANYAQVSQAAMASAKIILDSMGQWKTAVGTIRPDRA